MTHIKAKFHLVNEIKANIFVNMNVMKSKNMILNFDKKIFIIPTCQEIEVVISIERKKARIERTIRAVVQITISVKMIMIISIRLRNATLFKNKNYSFFFKIEQHLKSKGNFFAHVMKSEMTTIQMRNTSNKSYTIFKNLKVKHLRDYDEKNCFMIASKDCYLIVTSDESIDIRKKLMNRIMKKILLNEITIYENEITIKKLTTMIQKTSEI